MNLEILESVKFWSQFIHPIVMWVLFGMSIYALYLGLKIRETRAAKGKAKKELLKGKYNDKHHQVGSLLLSFMVIAMLTAMAVTYINNGKLFFGPHLLAGLGMVGIIATSASLTPFMQKGKIWARYSHITLTVILLGLFSWEAVTGMQIVQKILSRM